MSYTGRLIVAMAIIFVFVMSVLIKEDNRQEKTNEPEYVSKIFIDTDGCAYKIIRSRINRSRFGVVAHGECND